MTTTTPSPSPRRRQGFTLVEVLVAMALIVFIMVILTEAFSAGFGVFRALKSQGDMQERLRLTESLMRDDLVHYHFDGTNRLSTLNATTPPTAGYFFIQQNLSTNEGSDGVGVPSNSMSSTTLPVLCFTVNRYTPPDVPPVLSEKGYLPSGFFVARIPDGPGGNPGPLPAMSPTGPEQVLFACGPVDYLPSPTAPRGPPSNNVFLSQWAEVAYFLVANPGRFAGTTNAPGSTTPPQLYSLRRRVRVILDPNAGANEKTANASLNGANRIPNVPVPSTPTATDIYNARYAEMSCFPDTTNNLYFNSPTDLWASAANRMYNRPPLPPPLSPIGTPPLGGSGQIDWAGDDLVMTDVISLNVRVLPQPASSSPTGDFLDIPTFLAIGGGTGTQYDASAAMTPISAIEITIRVWDVKTSLARQITIVQDM
jgi:prepilin-type N-terminal cleavage/methylation domain-containing protein